MPTPISPKMSVKPKYQDAIRSDRAPPRSPDTDQAVCLHVQYAHGDPFQLPSSLNELLTSKSCNNFDVENAYPNFLKHILPDSPNIHEQMDSVPELRKIIQERYKVTKEAAKTLVHALMNDGGIKNWRKKHNVDSKIRDPHEVIIFKEGMRQTTEYLAQGNRAEKALSIIQKLQNKGKKEKKSEDESN